MTTMKKEFRDYLYLILKKNVDLVRHEIIGNLCIRSCTVTVYFQVVSLIFSFFSHINIRMSLDFLFS